MAFDELRVVAAAAGQFDATHPIGPGSSSGLFSGGDGIERVE